jgi:hypothetical protein
VQAELRAKTGSPNLGPTHVPQIQPPPIQRAFMNRHRARGSNSSIAPKLEPGIVSPLPPIQHISATSPKSRPTPSSHSASPTATTSYGSQHGASPAGSDHLSMQHPLPPLNPMKAPPLPAPQQPMGAMAAMGARQMHMAALQHQANRVRAGVGRSPAPFYPTPSFQNHIEQLGKLTRFLLPSPIL